MNTRTIILVSTIVACLGIAAWLFSRARGDAFGTYFYDVQAGSLYAVPGGTLAPTKAASGGEGVLAVVYACADCDDTSDRQIAYLQTNTDEYRQALQSGEEVTEKMTFEGQRYRTVDDPTWHTDGQEAANIIASAKARCTNGKPIRCLP